MMTSVNPLPECTLCASGKYNILVGAWRCLSCDTGKLSTADRSNCKDCEAGEYAYNNQECKSCDFGK